MKSRKCIALLCSLVAIFMLMSGCKPAKPNSEIQNNSENSAQQTGDQQGNDVTGQGNNGGSTLTLWLNGTGIYTVDDWQLYNSWADAGVSENDLSGYGRGQSIESGGGVLLATLTKTSVDNEMDFGLGNVFMTNNFRPTTQSAIDAAYLPEGSADTFVILSFEYGDEPVYLDKASSEPANEYFYLENPAAGESITYTLGYILTASERAAAEAGELYLWYSLDEPQDVSSMQLLHLSP